MMEIVKGKVTIITKGKENNIDDRNNVDHTHNNDANSNFYSKKDHNNRKLMMFLFFLLISITSAKEVMRFGRVGSFVS